MVSVEPYRAWAPLFHLAFLVVAALVALRPARMGRLLAAYMGLNYLAIGLVQTHAYKVTAFNGLLYGLYNLTHWFSPERCGVPAPAAPASLGLCPDPATPAAGCRARRGVRAPQPPLPLPSDSPASAKAGKLQGPCSHGLPGERKSEQATAALNPASRGHTPQGLPGKRKGKSQVHSTQRAGATLPRDSPASAKAN